MGWPFSRGDLPRRANQHRFCRGAVQPRSAKYSASPSTQINSKTLAIPFSQEGRFAIVTNVGDGMQWTRAASGARERARRMMLTRTAKSCGPDAPTLASSLRGNSQAMVAKEPGHQGEHEGNR